MDLRRAQRLITDYASSEARLREGRLSRFRGCFAAFADIHRAASAPAARRPLAERLVAMESAVGGYAVLRERLRKEPSRRTQCHDVPREGDAATARAEVAVPGAPADVGALAALLLARPIRKPYAES